jgi:phosphopantothenoylcysteine decarboxylase/phosphopantothenate--cysteine ligase
LLRGKKILLGVTASIAAYKSAWLVREFIKRGAEVRVVLSPAAKEFVTPLTLSTLSKNPVLWDFTAEEDSDLWNNHVELGLWADLMVVAPATANTLSKMASGRADNLLIATYLSAKCPVFVAPAMDLDMYKHPSTLENLEKLSSFGNRIIDAASGELASGLVGPGRMAEPEEIADFIAESLAVQSKFKGKKVLISAGPTYEAIDPVRFIGNHSSGKMGIRLAEELARKGAEVFLVCGPSAVTEQEEMKRYDVRSAQEMFEACTRLYPDMDVAIMAAAVADYRPAKIVDQKIKKEDSSLQIDLEPTIDILKTLGDAKENQILVGFALETENEEKNALAKMDRKNLDAIVLNSLREKGAGFGHDTNKVIIFGKDNMRLESELKSKAAIAGDIANFIEELL